MGGCSRRSWNNLSIDPKISTWWWKVDHKIGSWTDVPNMQVGGKLVDGVGHLESNHHLCHVVLHDVVEKLSEG